MPLLLSREETWETLNNVELKRHLQKIKIIKHLYVKREDSTSEICSHLNISTPTATALLNELVGSGLISKRGRGNSIGGRKPELYGLQDDSFYVLSIHMERSHTKMAIFDNNNRCIYGIQTFPLQLSKDQSGLKQLFEYIQTTIKSAAIPVHKLIGFGISMPGLVAAEEGRNYTFFTDEHAGTLQRVIEKKFKKPVFIHNDVKSACLAEYRFGKAQGQKNVLLLSIDWGVGLGIIMDGKLQSGTSGFAGEFGHIPLVEDGLLCACGKRGCLETIASGIALSRMAQEGMRAGQSSFLKDVYDTDISEIEPQVVVEAANKGDQFSINLLSEMGTNLGKGIAILIQLFNPESIILGGKIAEAGQFITIPIQHSINIYCMGQLRERTKIVLSDLGSEASLLGSVATVVENVLEQQLTVAR